MATRLARDFYQHNAQTVAKSLLGQRLVRLIAGQRLAGLIVETEAYLGAKDKAAHTFNGRRTKRNQSMWGDGGHAYVYFTYGMHFCFNVVAGTHGDPVAVLIRALEPVEGLDEMRRRRTSKTKSSAKHPLSDLALCSGPAKLCQALAIDRNLDGADLVAGEELFIEKARAKMLPRAKIVATPRVGVSYAQEWADKPLRYFIKGCAFVSRG
ncbi:MAG: DNA-3-methyladenine glycosylase [Phycisphaeraceae bacterium]|nr:DNA-3-methyladenine glycosylase [Phycisphaeraceae bacterium]